MTREEELQRLIRVQESLLRTRAMLDTRPIVALRAELADLTTPRPLPPARLESTEPPGMAALRHSTEAALRYVDAKITETVSRQASTVDGSGAIWLDGKSEAFREIRSYLAGVLEQVNQGSGAPSPDNAGVDRKTYEPPNCGNLKPHDQHFHSPAGGLTFNCPGAGTFKEDA